ncbi:MAG: HAMP domain-containing protein [Magnetococcales bacterium]|nr:HAMP domain-containing protein [Magnetococcales bacterium]
MLHRFALLQFSVPMTLLLFTLVVLVGVLLQNQQLVVQHVSVEYRHLLQHQLMFFKRVLPQELASGSLDGAERLLRQAADDNPSIRAAFVIDRAQQQVLISNREGWTGRPLHDLAADVPAELLIDRQQNATDLILAFNEPSLLAGQTTLSWTGQQGDRHHALLTILYDLTHPRERAYGLIVAETGPFLIFVTLAIAFLAVFFHFFLTRRVAVLVNSMRRFASGDYRSRADLHGGDELALIGHTFDQMADHIATIQAGLEQQVVQRTAELEQSLAHLCATQQQLILSEKRNARAALVIEISHEINTPLGIAITASTLLQDHADELATAFRDGQLRQSQLTSYLTTTDEALTALVTSLRRVAQMVNRFKATTTEQEESV